MSRTDLELFLAMLMSAESRVSAVLARAHVAESNRRDIMQAAERSGFWLPQTIDYFDSIMPRVAIDSKFVVAVPTSPATRRHRFALASWPSYDLGILCDRGGQAYYPHFVRSAGAKAPSAAGVGELEPWAWTLEEVISKFGEPDASDQWDLRRWLTYHAEPDGEASPLVLTFDVSLLQQVSTVV